jgi:hypothetical protein
MNARTLLDELRAVDVKFTADGDRLHVDAPAGSITDQMRTALVENKPGLLELLEWERRKLEVAGFKPKERCGKIIWQRPDDGFYVSQEAALHFLDPEKSLAPEIRAGQTERGNTTG